MKILVVSQYFWPENFRINDLVLELKKKGHEVTVLTGKPNYPEGNFYKGYTFFTKRKEYFNSIPVHRVPLVSRGKGTGKRLALNYFSFAFFSSFFAMFHRKRYDACFVFAISPITMVFPAIVHKKMYGTKVGIWVQDLWPESVVAAGKFNSGFVYGRLRNMVKYIYRQTDKIFISSQEFRASILEKDEKNESKIQYMPNWAEDIFFSSNIDVDKYKKKIPPGFVVMFAGNIGEAQDIDSILKAAIETRNEKDVKWVFIGGGRKKEWLIQQVAAESLNDTVFILDRYPLDAMPLLYVHANVLLVSLKDEKIFNLTIPAKTQSYMAFGKPVVAMLNGAGAAVIKEAACGFVSPSGDYISLAANVRQAKALSKEQLNEMGCNGRKFYEEEFSKVKIISELISWVEKK